MRRLSALVACVVSCLTFAVSAFAQPLESDPRLLTGTLDNGFRYIIRQHNKPEGRIGMWLHVSSGSLNETDEQRGIAHYLEHMAFNGSTNFPPGSVVPLFESFGMTFGRDQNAFTSFDQTTYQLALPDTKPETIEKGMLFFSDVAFRQLLLPDEIEKERQVIFGEKRARGGVGQRISEQLLPCLAPGSLIGARIPIGTEETLSAVQQPDFKAYYSKWYAPSNMTLMIVADMDPAPLVEQIKKHFGDAPRTPRPVDQDAKVTPYTQRRAVIVTDPELTDASIAITRVAAKEPPSTTLELARGELVDDIATMAFNRRMGKKVAAGKVSVLDAGANVQNFMNVAVLIQATAEGKPESWRSILAELGTELQRARLHGFTQRELDDVKTDILSGAEERVKREPTRPARQILSSMNNAVARGEPIRAAEQDLDLVKRLLPTITREEISKRFAERFDPSAVAFIATLPSSAQLPSEEELLSLGSAAVDVKPEADAEAERPTALLSKLPEAGTVAESAEHEASRIWSGWLSNGVRVHQRTMDDRKDEVTVVISLAGGTLEETAHNRGITQAAGQAWSRPATSTLTSNNIEDLLNGKTVRVGGGPTDSDTLTLTVSGSPTDLEHGMQVAYLLLTDPVIEKPAFDQWKTQTLQGIEARKKDPQRGFAEFAAKHLYPADDARFHPVTVEQVNALHLDAAQAWLKRLIAKAPIEVTIVGDLPRERAIELATRYLGSLPQRGRINPGLMADLRKIKRPAGPISGEATVESISPAATAMTGFFGPEPSNLAERRAMDLAARILSTRMVKTIREEKNLVYSIGSQYQPRWAIPGYSVFAAAAPTKPDSGPELTAAVAEMFDAFAKDGPTAEELVTAKKQTAKTLDESMKQPQYWIGATDTMDYRGLTPDDAVNAPEAYQAITADQIKTTFAKYWKPENAIRLVLRPVEPGSEKSSAQDEGAAKSAGH